MEAQPVNVVGLLLAALVATVVVTPLISVVVLWHYRRAVARSMRTTALGRPADVRPPVPVPASAPTRHFARPARIAVLDDRDWRVRDTGKDAWQRARRQMRGTAAVYVAAGLTSGLVTALVWLVAGDMEIGVRNVVGLTVLFSWLVVPTVLAVLAADRRTQLAAWAGYLVLVPLSTVGTGIRLVETMSLVVTFILPPGVALLALSGRNLRAVGPFLAVPVLLTSTGLLVWPWTALWFGERGASLEVATFGAVTVAALVGLVGFLHLGWTARQYARKRASDQTLLVSQWWFFLTAWQSLLLTPSGLEASLSVWAAYVAFRLVLTVGLRMRPRPAGPPLRLLLLRTFGAQRRSEHLLRRVGEHWRQLGGIQMIAGTDLVSATLEPHEFLDRLRGRLARRFIGTPGELRRRLTEFNVSPDRDGRYRVDELFCHDNTWREALQELVRRSDCILLDLRGFTRRHEGVTWEIGQLAQLVPLGRVLVLVDEETDQGFLRITLDRARAGLEAPPPDGPHGELRLLRTSTSGVDVRAVVGQLAASTAAGR